VKDDLPVCWTQRSLRALASMRTIRWEEPVCMARAPTPLCGTLTDRHGVRVMTLRSAGEVGIDPPPYERRSVVAK
jgi:hypothetical protein